MLVDSDGSGDISYEEFGEGLDSPEMVAFAYSLGIEVLDVKQFFKAISQNGTVAVDLETFVEGCIKSRGPAKSLDLVELMHLQRQSLSDFRSFREAICEQIDAIDLDIQAIF